MTVTQCADQLTRSLPLAFMLTLAGTAGAMEVKLATVNSSATARLNTPLTLGVPFSRGALADPARLTVRSGGTVVPAQFTKLAAWDDGSVRWALMDLQLSMPAGATNEIHLSDAGANVQPPAPVTVQEAADKVTVSTGPLQFTVNKQKFNLFNSIRVDGRDLVSSAGRGLVLSTEDGKEVVAGPPTSITIEQAGPLRATLCLRGKFPDVHKDLLGYTIRIQAFAGLKTLKVHAWLENNGAFGYHTKEGGTPLSDWLVFDGLSVELGVSLGDSLTAQCEGIQSPSPFKVRQFCRQWTGQEKVQYKKAPFYTWTDFQYDIRSGTNTLKTDARTDGVVRLTASNGALTTAIRHFWQNYEKAIELDGSSLKLWLWPRDGQWPRTGPRLNSPEFYDKFLASASKPGLYVLQGGVHKGHEFILDFSGHDPAQTSADLSDPLLAFAAPEYYRATAAAPGLFGAPSTRSGDSECDFKIASWLRMARSAFDPGHPNGIPKAREISHESSVMYFGDSSYWFGWMDFGDIQIPGRGPVSLGGDWLWLTLADALRMGSPAAFRLGVEMARHRVDVDQLWSDLEMEQCRGLIRRGSNFPAWHCGRTYWPPGVQDNWVAGLVLYHFLTGDLKAREACLRNAAGLRSAWQHILDSKPYGGPQGDVGANASSMSSYLAIHDLTGERRWVDAAMGLFNTNVVPKWKAQGPHLHSAEGQITGQDYIKEDQKYCFAIPYLCELHRRTGDAEVFKLLQAGADTPFPSSFFDAPLHLAGLHAYVGAVTGKPEYFTRAIEAWINGFPESKHPPVFMPGNSTWHHQAAVTLRAGHLFQYALSRRPVTPKVTP